MMRAFAAHAEGRGFAGLLIDPDAANEPAVRAYRRAGFEEALRHRDADGEIIVMKMPLEGPA
jgi:ribosomal protein S18 acetylase RimI-like enzyme